MLVSIFFRLIIKHLKKLNITADDRYVEMIDNVNRLFIHPESVSREEMDAWLADEEFMSVYQTMKMARNAQIEEPQQTEVDEAFRDLMDSMPDEKPHRAMHRKLYWGVAIAACLLCLCVMVFWGGAASPNHLAKKEHVWQRTKDGHVKVYESQKDNDIVCEMDGRKTKLNDSQVFSSHSSKGSVVTLTVPAGKTIPVVLSDGTKVWVNSDSKLAYPAKFSDEDRVVELVGEAYFDVAHDAERPFKVKNGSMTVLVHGTAFNVKGYEGEAPHVTLVRGSVSVENDKGQCTIKPGMDVSENSKGQLVEQKVDTQVFTSWKNGVYSFDDEALGNVMVVIGRCYNKSVVFASDNHVFDKLHFRVERSWSLQQVIDQLSLVCGLDIAINGNTITIK